MNNLIIEIKSTRRKHRCGKSFEWKSDGYIIGKLNKYNKKDEVVIFKRLTDPLTWDDFKCIYLGFREIETIKIEDLLDKVGKPKQNDWK